MKSLTEKFLDFLKKRKHTEHWLYIVFSQPNIYLKNLLKRTIIMGIFLVIVHLIAVELSLKENTIPSNMHGLIGIVIGLSLSFRTSTAYDRWWEARKILADIKSSLVYIKIKTKSTKHSSEISENLININKMKYRSIPIANNWLFPIVP